MKIFEALRNDHDVQRKLLDELAETSGDTEKRKRLYYQLKHELKIHADAEEKFFYVPLIKDGTNQDEARHGVAEHHEMDELIERLDETDFDAPAWLTIMKKLQDKVLHHLEDEEKDFFQLAGKVFKEQEKSTLAQGYIEEINDSRVLELS